MQVKDGKREAHKLTSIFTYFNVESKQFHFQQLFNHLTWGLRCIPVILVCIHVNGLPHVRNQCSEDGDDHKTLLRLTRILLCEAIQHSIAQKTNKKRQCLICKTSDYFLILTISERDKEVAWDTEAVWDSTVVSLLANSTSGSWLVSHVLVSVFWL